MFFLKQTHVPTICMFFHQFLLSQTYFHIDAKLMYDFKAMEGALSILLPC